MVVESLLSVCCKTLSLSKFCNIYTICTNKNEASFVTFPDKMETCYSCRLSVALSCATSCEKQNTKWRNTFVIAGNTLFVNEQVHKCTHLHEDI